jgi:hypothetical protein
MIRVGFSTQLKNPLSRLIRWLTKSKASHAWLLFDDTFFGLRMVMEATEVGFRILPFSNFQAEGNDIVAIVQPAAPLEDGVMAAGQWLGESYDFAGLLGTSFVLLGRWLRRKWKNPLASPHAMFCSEAVVRVIQAAKYPGSEALVPASTTPQDLLNFFSRTGAVGAVFRR